MIIDTNVYSAHARISVPVDELFANTTDIKLPLPVIAELRAGFLGGNRSEVNNQILDDFLSQPIVTVLYPDDETTRHYAEIALFCRGKGKSLSNNDVWIAALALQYDEQLATFDKDFAGLQPLLGSKLVILTA